jgi:hypothetical protein
MDINHFLQNFKTRYIWYLFPFFISAIYFFTEDNPDEPFFTFLASFMFTSILYFILHARSSTDVETGKKYRGKSGEEFKEYETYYGPEKYMDPQAKRMMILYLIIPFIIISIATMASAIFR